MTSQTKGDKSTFSEKHDELAEVDEEFDNECELLLMKLRKEKKNTLTNGSAVSV